MATHNVTYAKHASLSSGTVDTVNFRALDGGLCPLKVVNRHSTADLYFTINPADGGSAPTPTVEGDNTYVVRPDESFTYQQHVVTQVKLVAQQNVPYSVQLIC